MEDGDVAERVFAAGRVHRQRRLEAADRRVLGVDLGVALVDRQHGVVLPALGDKLLQIVEAGDRTLRIGR